MLREKEKFSEYHFRELVGLMGTVHLLEGDFESSKNLLRNNIRMSIEDNENKALVLNNLGIASWLHYRNQLKK